MLARRSRHKPRFNKHMVLADFDRHPGATSQEIADRIGCAPEYVRATLKRNGKKLSRPSPGHQSELYALGRAARACGFTVVDLDSIRKDMGE